MKAAVCYEFKKPLVVEEIDIDPPQKGEVKVRIGVTAICHSDIHVIKGELGLRTPLVAGHESAGYVEELGEGVTSVQPGDPVVVSLLASCGHCSQCVLGLQWMCENRWPLERESRLHNKRGEALHHMSRVSSFAEYVIVDRSQVVPIPPDMPIESASLLACGVITGFGAAVNRAHVQPMSSALVIGVGGVGMNSVQGAALCGAYPVIAMDVSDAKLEASRLFGATHTVNAKDEDAAKTVRSLTSKRGADYVFVAVGSGAAIQQGFAMSAPRGMIVLIGLPPITEPVMLPPVLVWNERVVTMSRTGTARLQVEIPKMVALYQAGKLKLDEMISNRYPLERINEAIEEVEKGDVLRNVITF